MSVLISIGLWRLGFAAFLMLAFAGFIWWAATMYERERAARERMADAIAAARNDLPDMLTAAELDEQAERLMRVLAAGGFSAVQETYSAPDAEEKMRGGMARGGRA